MLEFPSEIFYPTTVLGSAAIFACLVLASMTLQRHNSVLRVIVFVAACAAYLGCLATLNDRPISRFRSAYHAIQPGMTAREVDQVMAQHFPGRKPHCGWSEDRTSYSSALVNLDPTLSEGFTITLQGGYVTEKSYITD